MSPRRASPPPEPLEIRRLVTCVFHTEAQVTRFLETPGWEQLKCVLAMRRLVAIPSWDQAAGTIAARYAHNLLRLQSELMFLYDEVWMEVVDVEGRAAGLQFRGEVVWLPR